MEREEIMLRQMAGQHLLQKTDVATAVHDLCGVQAQFLSNALHALAIRCTAVETQQLIKSWTLRGTMHVFDRQDLPLMLHQGRSHFLRPCDTMADDEKVSAERKRFFADLIVQLINSGIDEREQLKEQCFRTGMTPDEADSLFNPWGGLIRALCEEGHICHKVQEKKAFQLCEPFEPMEERAAELELARRYFTHYGPATIRDAAYFFGTTQSRVRQWLDELPVSSNACEGRTYFWIPTVEVSNDNMPACIFLAGFDPLMLGYEKKESLFLPPEHLRGIFNLAGIVMPAVLLHGRVCGRWKKTGRRVQIMLFENVRDVQLIDENARRVWPDLRSIEWL